MIIQVYWADAVIIECENGDEAKALNRSPVYRSGIQKRGHEATADAMMRLEKALKPAITVLQT